MGWRRLAGIAALTTMACACDGSPKDPRACLADAKKRDAVEKGIAITPEQGSPAMVENGGAFIVQYFVTDFRQKVRAVDEIASAEDLRAASYAGTDPWAVDNADVLTASFQSNDPLEGDPNSPFVAHDADTHLYVVSPVPSEMYEGIVVGTSFITDGCERFVESLDGYISNPVRFSRTQSGEWEIGQWYAENY